MSTLAQSQQITMTSEPTVEQIVREKLGNLSVWLKSLAPKYPKLVVLEQKFSKYLVPGGEAPFVIWVKNNVKPWENDLDSILETVLGLHGLKKTDIEPDHYDKFKRYLQLFCKLAPQ